MACVTDLILFSDIIWCPSSDLFFSALVLDYPSCCVPGCFPMEYNFLLLILSTVCSLIFLFFIYTYSYMCSLYLQVCPSLCFAVLLCIISKITCSSVTFLNAFVLANFAIYFCTYKTYEKTLKLIKNLQKRGIIVCHRGIWGTVFCFPLRKNSLVSERFALGNAVMS